MQGVTSKPQHAYARADATLRKVQSTRADNRANTDKERMNSLFSNGASLAHKLTNYANKVHNPGLASDGSLSHVKRMEEQWETFAKLWQADDEDAGQAYFKTFQRLREHLMKERVQGSALGLEQLRQKLAPQAILLALKSFKQKTSTGYCGAVLSQLRGCPEEV